MELVIRPAHGAGLGQKASLAGQHVDVVDQMRMSSITMSSALMSLANGLRTTDPSMAAR
jgi:hypothetical protein